MKFVTTTTTLV